MSTLPKIRLTYFNTEGRAEITRLILAQAGVEFEDERIEVEQFEKLRKSELKKEGKHFRRCLARYLDI
jgi:hypothetical protein